MAALLLLPVLCQAQWQARMISSISGGEQYYKVYSDLNKYRYDFKQDGMDAVVIVDPAINQTMIMLVDDKMVHYTACDGMMSRMNDPVQAYIAYRQYGEELSEGMEEIIGYKCKKTTIYQGDKPLFSQWYAEELNFPVKLIGHWAENTYMQLSEINDWQVNDTVFEVPDDYMRVDEKLRPLTAEPPPPENWKTTEAILPLDMPVERGMAIRFDIGEEVHYNVTIENTGDTPCKFIFHEYEDGSERPDDKQGPPDWRTRRLYMQEDYNMTFAWKPGFTIIFKFFEGSAKMQVHKD